jgi:N-carbamoyl-L-amino-acid hydrolase
LGPCHDEPGIVTSVVEDCRHPHSISGISILTRLAQMYSEARHAERSSSHAKGMWRSPGSASGTSRHRPFDPELISLCDDAIRETCGVSHRLPSGPLHDAAEIAAAGVPTRD